MDASKNVELQAKEVVVNIHPAVIKRMPFAAGFNSNSMKAGQIVGLSSGKLVVADGSTTHAYGVVLEDLDTTAAGFVNVCVHGTVAKDLLLGYDGSDAAEDSEVADLEAAGIWAL